VKRIDSLYYYSLTINPFLYRKLDLRLYNSFIANFADDYARRNNVSANEVQYEIQRWLNDGASSSMRAWQAYGEGRFDDALRYYADAIKQTKQKAEYRADRGRLFFQLNQADSALTELAQALDEMRKTDKKDLVFVYSSKALYEHSIGLIQERLGNPAAAKEAFGRALQEDLSYFPAHVQLGYLALEAKDTTTALSEMDLAVQIRGDDPMLRFVYGYSLAVSGKFQDAEVQLRKAIEIDPLFAAPYSQLAEVLDGEGKASDALAQYRSFLALSSQSDLRRKDVEERVRVLASKSNE
jgi:tetratricopeptide (TPR) repeat protein